MPYLTVDQYIARFGQQETTILTNEVPSGAPGGDTYDSSKVESAIDDAAEVVEGYLGARYAVPVADPPRIVQGWTAALAREKLFEQVGRVNDAATQAADRARAQLKDVQAGKMTLPIAEGSDPIPSSGTLGNATSSMDRDRPIFGDRTLDRFTMPVSGYYGACWRRGT
jgi:phage gp36-like protein